jgi:hypothetical protein
MNDANGRIDSVFDRRHALGIRISICYDAEQKSGSAHIKRSPIRASFICRPVAERIAMGHALLTVFLF